MKETYQILRSIRALISSADFINRHKAKFKDFTRRRILSYPVILVFILNGIRKSLQVQLNELTDIIDLPIISKQAFSAARHKLSASAFVEMNDALVREYYKEGKSPKFFFGYLVAAIDGSTLQLPDSEEIRDKYGAATNNTKKDMPMGRCSHVYDVLNGITLDAILQPYACTERTACIEHIKRLKTLVKDVCGIDKILLIFDRGYPSLAVIAACIVAGIDFMIRCKPCFLSIPKEMIKNGQNDLVIKDLWKNLNAARRRNLQKHFPNIESLPNCDVRFVLVTLDTGEIEVLLTSLTDQRIFPHSIFSGVYSFRWKIEENYKFFKVRVEIENFSGFSTNAIEQDFHATVFTANVRTLLANEAQEELDQERNHKKYKYESKVNKNVSAGALKDTIIDMLLDERKSLKKYCDQIKEKMKRSTELIRPGRKYARKRKTRHKFPMNRRRGI